MPQLDFATYAPQLIWLALVFGVLYIIMSRVALPRIATVIEERRDRIANDLDTAAQLKRDSDDAIAAYETALQDARAKAHAIAQETRDRLTAETDAHRADLEGQLAARMQDAEKRITTTKDKAMSNVRDVAVDVADAITNQLLGESDRNAAAKAVDGELA
ncbi:MAG: F0F1 ATP synthase subunit B' [Alphaproteobacteria bacterium]|jgi:F-type H+-transporting ATPase subunit b|nr:F0F1 ATP synthase subunit B' [Rhodobiaceae bacterium]MBO6544641.1 F0F1 ATP synthase subunit B' [Alphaproteobacteria bacterium]MBO6627944.1 F0F1 ATP synthase subunit B' [Alphaproteobacteria bacterium]MDF1625514.1 F0F1 ATP synthase subunit B' [Parvibaculaceae bacterium]